MSFGSAIFLFAFLPASVALYHLIPGTRAKNICLLTASLLFYGFGRLADLPILVGLALFNYLLGLFLRRRWVLALGVSLDLGVLLFYKFLFPASLPLGISFFTFQAISYLADAYRDPAQTSRRFIPLLQYLCFFPNLISGPLWKFQDMRPMLEHRQTTPEATAKGLRRFTVGLGKKLLLSAPLGLAVDTVYALDPSALDFRTSWLGAVCYALHLYLDFSGYSDMALGLGSMFGFQLPENFDLPYLAVSITDFWRRWHISLSRWFRDYLYIPLGGNRKGPARQLDLPPLGPLAWAAVRSGNGDPSEKYEPPLVRANLRAAGRGDRLRAVSRRNAGAGLWADCQAVHRLFPHRRLHPSIGIRID